MSNTVLYQEKAGIGTLTFNRPEVFNAMNDELMRELRDRTSGLKDSKTIRVLVVRGAGNAFLAGGDVGMFHARKDDPDLPNQVEIMGNILHESVTNFRNMPFPIIAQVHGAVAGAGLSLMLACDLIVAADNSHFSTAYTRIGLSPDGGGSWLLPRCVGMHKAAELFMLSERFDANQAKEWGLVNRVVPMEKLDETVDALAGRLASGATQAFAHVKRLLNQSLFTPLHRQLADEVDAFKMSTTTADFREGVSAFVEKRPPKFEG